MRFLEMRAAREWRLKPSEWDALSEDDKAEMIAFVTTEDKMRAREQEEND